MSATLILSTSTWIVIVVALIGLVLLLVLLLVRTTVSVEEQIGALDEPCPRCHGAGCANCSGSGRV